MAGKVLSAEDFGKDGPLVFMVLLDKTHVDEAGEPLPESVREFRFPSFEQYNAINPFDASKPIVGRPANETKAQYRQRCRNEAKALAEHEAAAKPAGTRIAGLEGDL